MPNKIKVTKEDILNCALKITKNESVMSMRIIAKELVLDSTDLLLF